MSNPVTLLPSAGRAVPHLHQAILQGGLPEELVWLVHLRVSQINGCAACVHLGVTSARRAGATEERLHQLTAWRDATFYTDAERAALTLAEAVTRLADRPDEAVDDTLWESTARHFDEQQMAALLLAIASANFFNRLNAVIRTPAGAL